MIYSLFVRKPSENSFLVSSRTWRYSPPSLERCGVQWIHKWALHYLVYSAAPLREPISEGERERESSRGQESSREVEQRWLERFGEGEEGQMIIFGTRCCEWSESRQKNSPFNLDVYLVRRFSNQIDVVSCRALFFNLRKRGWLWTRKMRVCWIANKYGLECTCHATRPSLHFRHYFFSYNVSLCLT